MDRDMKGRLDLLFKMDVIKAYFVPYVAPGVTLKIATDLGIKDQNGNKKRFYEETVYKSSKYKNTDELVSATYRVNSYLVLEYPNPNYQNGTNMMKSKVLFIRAYAMDDLISAMREFNSTIRNSFNLKDGNVIVYADRAKTITTYPSSSSSISFSPDVYEVGGAEPHKEIGVRITVNDEYSFVVSGETTWPELLYKISRCDLTMLSFQMVQSYMAMLPGMAVSRIGDGRYSSTSRYAPYWEDPDDIINQPDSVGVSRSRPVTYEEKKKSFFSDP